MKNMHCSQSDSRRKLSERLQKKGKMMICTRAGHSSLCFLKQRVRAFPMKVIEKDMCCNACVEIPSISMIYWETFFKKERRSKQNQTYESVATEMRRKRKWFFVLTLKKNRSYICYTYDTLWSNTIPMYSRNLMREYPQNVIWIILRSTLYWITCECEVMSHRAIAIFISLSFFFSIEISSEKQTFFTLRALFFETSFLEIQRTLLSYVHRTLSF